MGFIGGVMFTIIVIYFHILIVHIHLKLEKLRLESGELKKLRQELEELKKLKEALEEKFLDTTRDLDKRLSNSEEHEKSINYKMIDVNKEINKLKERIK